MSYVLVFSKTAQNDLKMHKKSGDKSVLKKIEKLLHELLEHPHEGTGQPERLKYEFSGLYSRRITRKHRVIYAVYDETATVHVLSLASHYQYK